jgi:hypothetical protein
MIRLAQHVRPHPDVVDAELDGQDTVLLHLEKKLYYSLNSTGTRIWQGLKQGLVLQEISRRLQQEFDVEPEHAERSVLALVEELCRQELAEPLP